MRTHIDDQPQHPRLVTLPVMTLLAGVSRRTMFRLISQGVVPRICIGHRTHLYDPEDVINALKQHFGEGCPAAE